MEHARAAEQPAVVSRTTRIDAPPFEAVFDTLPRPRVVWNAADDALAVGGGAAATLSARGSERFEEIRRQATALFESGDVHAGTEAARPRLFGGFAFHADGTGTEPWTSFPDARFVLPRVQVTYAENGQWVTVNAAGSDAHPDAVEERLADHAESLEATDPGESRPPRPGITTRRLTTTREEWCDGVGSALDRIDAGQLRKVVLAQAMEVTLDADLSRAATLARLSEAYPDCHLFCVEPTGAADPATFLGATPEQLVSVRGRTVETDALAGTTGRGETPAEDEWLAEELLADEKNVHEHEIVVDAIRTQLSPFATAVTTGDRRIRRLATVQHLHTPVSAELDSDRHVLELVEALHPTPAVGGIPPGEALETIRRTEPFDRGWYAGPVGWIDAAGNGTFAVAIRSAVVSRRAATLFAGVGIVGDSDPDHEWDEVQLKYRPILDELER